MTLCIYVCVSMCVCLLVCVWVCVYLHTNMSGVHWVRCVRRCSASMCGVGLHVWRRPTRVDMQSRKQALHKTFIAFHLGFTFPTNYLLSPPCTLSFIWYMLVRCSMCVQCYMCVQCTCVHTVTYVYSVTCVIWVYSVIFVYSVTCVYSVTYVYSV